MTSQCITHHHACDCREKEFEETAAENAELKRKLELAIEYLKNIESGAVYIVAKSPKTHAREALKQLKPK